MDWEKIKKNIKDGAVVSMEKIEEYTKIGKLKIDEIAAKRKILKSFADMGERLYDLIGEGKPSGIDKDLAVVKAVDKIKSLKKEIAAINEKIKGIQEEAKKSHKSGDDDEFAGV